ncbi:MAG: GntR family transcriptional regulator [Eubacteriales bacterium]|nr:GntR family transcriptional regulator [Eubacteriales bacterium]
MKKTNFLQQNAYDFLIEAIKNGSLISDKIYSLNQMAQEIGVSKTPLRDAVLRLEQERYIDILPSKGFQLHRMTETDIIETYEMREALELFCFKKLSQGLTTERGQLYYNKLRGKVNAQNEIIATTNDPEEFARKDYEFHRSLVQFVGNEAMLEIYRQFMYRIFWLNVTSFTKEGRMIDTAKEHESMLAMVEQHDIASLESLLKHHLVIAENINLELLDDL